MPSMSLIQRIVRVPLVISVRPPRPMILAGVTCSPIIKENISWPQVSYRPVPLGECLPDADREWLGAWRKHMLQPDDVCKSQRVDVVPYIDPILKHNPQAYNDFLKECRRT